MGDLKSKNWIIAKGLMFLMIGGMASGQLVALSLNWLVIVLHLVAIWGFCRFYYFAFYVIEHYVDGNYRFAGLWDFASYLLRKDHKSEG